MTRLITLISECCPIILIVIGSLMAIIFAVYLVILNTNNLGHYPTKKEDVISAGMSNGIVLAVIGLFSVYTSPKVTLISLLFLLAIDLFYFDSLRKR